MPPAPHPATVDLNGEGTFYLVWSPEGPTEPKRTYPTHSQALAAAWHTAKCFPGQSFYVLKRASRAAYTAPVVLEAEAA